MNPNNFLKNIFIVITTNIIFIHIVYAKQDYCPAQSIVDQMHEQKRTDLEIRYFFAYKKDVEACQLRIESIDHNIKIIKKEEPYNRSIEIQFKSLEPAPKLPKCPDVSNPISGGAVDTAYLLGMNIYKIREMVKQGKQATIHGNVANVELNPKTGLPVIQIQFFNFCNLSKNDKTLSELSLGDFIVVSGITDYGPYCSQTNEYGVTQQFNCLQIRHCKIEHELTKTLTKCTMDSD